MVTLKMINPIPLLGVKMKTWSFIVPENLAERINQIVNRYGYTSKSELIREALRVYIRGLEEEKEEAIIV